MRITPCFAFIPTEAMKVYGIDAEYTFSFDDLKTNPTYDYRDYNRIIESVQEWCEAQFGPSGLERRIWVTQGWFVAFWRETDAAAFKLCWC